MLCILLAIVAWLSIDPHARAANALTTEELAARELPTVVNIFSLRVAVPSAATSVAASQRPDAAGGAGSAMPSAALAAPERSRLLGSGFIIDPAGLIVTNRHVIAGASDILVTLQDNTLLRATLVAQADSVDLAVLKVTPDAPLPAVKFADSDAVQVADRVLAIGNPLGLGGSVTEGIVSALNRDISASPFDDFIQTDAAINHGNSGGPLFNDHGEVIGMNTAIFSPDATGGSIGLGFAIPSNDIKFVADALLEPGGMRVGTLDFRIQQVTPEIADALNMPKAEGVIVGGTTEGGGASRCGITAGDIVLRYGSMPVKDVRALARAIAHTHPGTVVNLLVWRNEEPMVIAATVQALPQVASVAQARPPAATVPADPGWRLSDLDDAARHAYGFMPASAGVVVTEVTAGGTADEAGLKDRDVILQVQQDKVASPADVVRLMRAARTRQRRYVVLLVRNSDGLRWFALSLE